MNKIESKPVAFFDLDETLINTKSMFSFLRFYLEKKQGDNGIRKFQSRMRLFSNLARVGVPRYMINRLYYFMFIFNNSEEFKFFAIMWFDENIKTDSFFIEPLVKELKNHQLNGVDVCLVSGSCRHIINPIAEYLNVDNIICSEQREFRRFFTGGIEKPMIGNNKKKAVLKFIQSREGVSPADCYAYGDHITDLGMLEVVGHPAIVDHHRYEPSSFVKLARERQWKIIHP